MVKHVILWKLKDDVADKESVKRGIKEGLEGLKGKIPGLVDVTVRIDGLAGSIADAMLDTTFESEAVLNGYATHPVIATQRPAFAGGLGGCSEFALRRFQQHSAHYVYSWHCPTVGDSAYGNHRERRVRRVWRSDRS